MGPTGAQIDTFISVFMLFLTIRIPGSQFFGSSRFWGFLLLVITHRPQHTSAVSAPRGKSVTVSAPARFALSPLFDNPERNPWGKQWTAFIRQYIVCGTYASHLNIVSRKIFPRAFPCHLRKYAPLILKKGKILFLAGKH